MFGERELLDTLSFFLSLPLGRIGCLVTSPCALAGRPQSYFARQLCRTDQSVALFVLIGIKCYQDGDTGNLQIFYGSVSIGFLEITCYFAESAQALRQTGSNSESQSTWCQSITSWSKEISFMTPGYFTRHKSAVLWIGYIIFIIFSCYFSVLNNSRSPIPAGTRVMHCRLLTSLYDHGFL